MKGGRFFLLLLNINQAVVNVPGEDDIVEAQPDIVAEDAFFRRRSSRCFSGQHRSYFPKLTEALKMPEILNMVTIIGKYLVEKQITILESLCMYGDNSNAWFETTVRQGCPPH